MLKNKTVRREYIENKENWVIKDKSEFLHLNILELKLNETHSLIKFEREILPVEKEKRINFYFFDLGYKAGDYVPFDFGNPYYHLNNGVLETVSLSLNGAVELLKNL